MNLDRNKIILLKPELKRESVFVKEWGGTVWVRTLTAWERDHLEAAWEATKRVNFRARLAVATVCDNHGVDLFMIGDIETLGQMPAPALEGIVEKAFKLNRFTKQDIEDLEKNSEPGPSVASSSVSRP
jgi:hypothetical protein